MNADEQLIRVAEDLVAACERQIRRRRRRRDLALLLGAETLIAPFAGVSWTLSTMAATVASYIMFTYDPL